MAFLIYLYKESMMKLKKYLSILPFAFAALSASATTDNVPLEADKGSVFHFSTKVSRTVEKDLMQADIYSRKSGKNLGELKKTVSTNLNKVLEAVKQYPSIDVSADGVTNHASYDNKGKVVGWETEGHIILKSKDFDAMAKVLENLGNEIAINYIDFSVSPEKMASLEDEMTLDIIKQFQHKAEVIQQGLKAKNYVLTDIHLSTPNSGNNYSQARMYKAVPLAASMDSAPEAMPMEAGKETISATASGKVTFK